MSLLCPIAQTNQSEVSNTFINNTCNKFDDDELMPVCFDVINSDPREDLKLDIRGLFAIFMNHSIANGTDNYSYLLQQLKRSDLDNKTRVCVEGYEVVVAILKSSLEQLFKNDNENKEMIGSMTTAFDAISTCEFDFEGYVTEPPVWEAPSLTLSRLLGVSIGFANLLDCNQVLPCNY
ncbi:unnamed protein product [Citrullus colocynthis]|uniref:Pectinesterase inhibitor domain-containing protein n=1 Tax=Citrullus colocynthis TaxID=252529 RepID=A0ABP0Z345_9ROSI